MVSDHFADRLIRGLMLGTLLLALATWRWPIQEPAGMTQQNIRRNIDGYNLRTIVQTRLANEKTHGELPPEALIDVHTLAGNLALAGLNDARHWLSRVDPVLDNSPKASATDKAGETQPRPILNASNPNEIAPAFRAAPLAWAAALVSSISPLPPETPVMWTRGLQANGTWRADSPYGTWGGYMAFADGRLERFRGKVQGLSKWGTHEPTDNIAETLPPGTLISEHIVPPEVAEKLKRVAIFHRVVTIGLNAAVGIGMLAMLACLATQSGQRNRHWISTGVVAIVLAWAFPILADTIS
jgi:hypothetical protein